MKKLLILALAFSATTTFAATESMAQFDINKMECHCDKHKMIFEVKDGYTVVDMSKHCMINENKTKSTVRFMDDNSNKQVTCAVKDGKVIAKSCQVYTPEDKSTYKRSSKMNASELHHNTVNNN